MIGATHLEAVARDRGRVNLYLTDLWRRPMPMDGVTGTITFYDDAGSHPVAVEIEGDHLVVQGPAPRKSSVRIRVELLHQVGPIGMTYELPIQPEAAGAVGVLRAGCEAASVADRDVPRCQLRMTAPITAMDSSDAGDLLAVAAVGVGVTVWELPAMRLRTSLAAAPTSSVTSEEMPHAESVNAVAFGPDGREIAIALEGRILVHSTGDGRLLRELPRNSGMIRTITWSPVQSELLVLGFYEHGASIVDARDGVVHAVLATPDEAAAVGWSPDGQRIAVATDAGRLGICDRNAPRKCNWGHTGGRVHRVEWLDGLHVVVAQATGATSIWSNDAIQQTQLSPVAALPAVVVSPRSDALAAGGQDGTIHLSTPTAAERGVSLRAHDAPITALSWVGAGLVSGDAAGLVSVWDTADDHRRAVMREMSID